MEVGSWEDGEIGQWGEDCPVGRVFRVVVTGVTLVVALLAGFSLVQG